MLLKQLTFFDFYRIILEKKFYFYVNFAFHFLPVNRKKFLEKSKKIGL